MAFAEHQAQVVQPQTDPADQLTKYRESVEETVALVKSLTDVCPTTRDLIDVLELALMSDGQLRLVLKNFLSQAQSQGKR